MRSLCIRNSLLSSCLPWALLETTLSFWWLTLGINVIVMPLSSDECISLVKSHAWLKTTLCVNMTPDWNTIAPGAYVMNLPSRMRKPLSLPQNLTRWVVVNQGCIYVESSFTPETYLMLYCYSQEIHSLKAQLEAAKYDVIKYCIGTIVSISAVGLAVLRIVMWIKRIRSFIYPNSSVETR